VKIRFETAFFEGQKVIAIDGDVFDWGLDEDSLSQANAHASNKEVMKAIHYDIRNYFLDCLSESIGFKPTMKQVNKALELGYIEK
jgi:hypothetical protein